MNSDIQTCVNLLREIAEIANHASLTGGLGGGERRAVARYNSTLSQLVQLGAVGPDLFEPLPEDAGYGEIGIEARMLAASVGKAPEEFRDEVSQDPGILLRLAPFVDRKDLAEMVREQLRQGGILDMETVAHLGPFLDKDVIGELLRGRFTPKPPRAPVPPPAPVAPPTPPPVVPEAVEPPQVEEPSTPGPETRVNVAAVIDMLKNPNLSYEERDRLLEQLRMS